MFVRGRRAVLGLAVSVAVFGSLVLAPAASAELITPIGRDSKLAVSGPTFAQLQSDHVYTYVEYPATLRVVTLTITFPIVGGTVDTDTMLGIVNHAGGITITKWNDAETAIERELKVINFRMVNGMTVIGDAPDLLGLPNPVFNLVNPVITEGPDGSVVFKAQAQIDALTATVLNVYFDTTVFTPNLVLGNWTSTIQSQSYPRPMGAAKLRVSLVPAFDQCFAPNSTHGEPLSKDSCSPADPASNHLTTPSDDSSLANGSFILKVRCTDGAVPPCPAPGEQQDVGINVTANDVRKSSDGSEYTGQLQARLPLKITDDYNAETGQLHATTKRTSFNFAVPCSATPGPEGGSCALASSANAVMPGVVLENKRANWEIGQIAVYDGGPDGIAATNTGNTPFLRQAIFVP